MCILFSFVQLSIIRIENEKMHTERCHKASQITHFLAQKCKRCSNQHLKIHNQLIIILSNVVIYIINISISVSMAICRQTRLASSHQLSYTLVHNSKNTTYHNKWHSFYRSDVRHFTTNSQTLKKTQLTPLLH